MFDLHKNNHMMIINNFYNRCGGKLKLSQGHLGVRSPLFIGMLSGLFSGLAFITHFPVLFIFSVLVFIYQLRKTETIAQSLLMGFSYALFFYSSGLYVLLALIEQYTLSDSLIIILIIFLALSYLVLLFLLSVFVLRFFSRCSDVVWAIIIMPTVFALGEWLKTFLFTGLPWFQSSHLFVDILNVEYSMFGEIGVGFLVYTLVGCLYLLIQHAKQVSRIRLISVSLVLLLMVFTVHHAMYDYVYQDEIDVDSVDIRLINTQVSTEEKNSMHQSASRLMQYQDIAQLQPKPDLVFLPEGVIEKSLHFYPETVKKGFDELKKQGIYSLSGGYYRDLVGEYNVIYANNSQSPVYMKQHLIPFGEYSPKTFHFLNSYFPNIQHGELTSKQHYSDVVRVAGKVIAPMICFEVFFSYEARENIIKSGMIAVFTDLDFLKTNWVKHYLLNIARVRAMEFSKPLVQSANGSITAFVNKKGKIETMASSSSSYINKTVSLSYKPSLFASSGYLYALFLPFTNGIFVLLLSAGSFLTGKRSNYVWQQ